MHGFSALSQRWFALGALLGIAALGCRAGVGDKCDKGEARCLDGARALVCEAGQYIEVPCRGARGCAASEKAMDCDVGKNQSGDRCSRDEEGAAVCRDAHTLLACHGGRYELVPCRGPSGCVVESGRALCDTSVGVNGDACRDEGKKCCAEDKSAVLACKDHRYGVLYSCRGPRGCTVSGSKLDCDMTLAVEGDSCDPRLEGHIACNGDHSATLICKGARFVLDEKCKAGTSCFAEGNQTQCKKPH